MTDQKTLTFMEAIEEARKGAVISLHDNPVPMVFRDDYLRHDNGHSISCGSRILDGRYLIVTPAPKPKVKVYLYAIKHPGGKWVILNDIFFSSYEEAFEYAGNKTNPVYLKRLDWSEIEVEE